MRFLQPYARPSRPPADKVQLSHPGRWAAGYGWDYGNPQHSTEMQRELALRIVALVFTFVNAVAEAQESTGSFYVIAGAGFPHQDGVQGAQTMNYAAPPGGGTQAWIVGGGIFVAPTASVELEASGTGTMNSRQRIRSAGGRLVTYDEDRRDRSFSINLRLYLSRWRRVQFNPVGGIGVVQHSGWSQLIAVNDAPVMSTRLPRDLPTDVGVTMGFDVRIGGEHLALMPSFRFWRRITDRYPPNRSETTGQYLGGASEWTLSPGLVARVDF